MRAQVRRVRAGEWQRLRELRLAALADSPSAFLATWSEEAAFAEDVWKARAADGEAGDERVTFVTEDGGEWLGLATGLASVTIMQRLGHAIADGGAVLVGMFVVPHARRRGVGRALVEAVAAWARAGSAPALHLWVTATNAGAIELYRRCGFRTLPPAPARPGEAARQEICMTRDLVARVER
jgi:GNAT superfamily N-acetyltransferase